MQHVQEERDFWGLARIMLQDPLLEEIHCFLTQTRTAQTVSSKYFNNFLQPNMDRRWGLVKLLRKYTPNPKNVTGGGGGRNHHTVIRRVGATSPVSKHKRYKQNTVIQGRVFCLFLQTPNLVRLSVGVNCYQLFIYQGDTSSPTFHCSAHTQA